MPPRYGAFIQTNILTLTKMKTNSKNELIKLGDTFKPAHYKYTVIAYYTVYKQDRNGNTYHRVQLCDMQGNDIADSGKTYGYGSQYEVTAKEMVIACLDLPKKYVAGEGRKYLNDTFQKMADDKFLKIDYRMVNI